MQRGHTVRGPSAMYLAGVDAVVVLGGVAAAVLGLVAHALPQVVHAVLAA